MFFPEQVNPQCKVWAFQLRKALLEKKMLKPTQLVNSIRDFGELRKKVQDERITNVVDWYCEHAGEEYIPRVDTTNLFVRRFEQIANAMLRQDAPEEIDKESAFTASVYDQQCTWPAEIRGNLPAVVQRSRDNWKAFKKIMKEHKGLPRDMDFLYHVLLAHPRFIEDEWMQLLQQAHGWKDTFLGAVMRLAFNPASDVFRASFWHKWSQGWTTRTQSFDKLLDLLIKEHLQ